jgi:hypothetical protein
MINYTTTSQVHSETWETESISLSIDESRLDELKSLEGQYQLHSEFLAQGVNEGWIRKL